MGRTNGNGSRSTTLLQSLRLTNLLSFGPDTEAVELGSLNLLIGPNGSGKSNFVEGIGLLQAAARDLVAPVREGGGVDAWLWRGDSSSTAGLEAVLAHAPGKRLRHRISFTGAGGRLTVVDERIENASVRATGARSRPGDRRGHAGKDKGSPYVYFGYEKGRPMMRAKARMRALRRADLDPQQSVLSQRKDPEQYPELSFLGGAYEEIRLYRDWSFGRGSAPKRLQPTDLLTNYLSEDVRNLALVLLNRFHADRALKDRLVQELQNVLEAARDIDVRVFGGMIQLVVHEEGCQTPASRLSDGTLRWLALLAVLLDPSPPRLVCIEEPELGLHPDLLPGLARLLREASERTQLVVTTHSDVLVDCFTSTPEVVLVCEREAGSTTMRRLSREPLAAWLEKYSLGQLWSRGHLGGNRW